MYYDSGMFIVNSAMYFNPPEFVLPVNISSLLFGSTASVLTLQNPFPSSVISQPSLNVLSPSLVTPYMQQWNLTLERAFDSIGTFGLGYAGSKGTHLVQMSDLNQPCILVQSSCNTTTPQYQSQGVMQDPCVPAIWRHCVYRQHGELELQRHGAHVSSGDGRTDVSVGCVHMVPLTL